MRLTGSEVIVESLIEREVPYMVGIPGHGSVNFIDPLKDRRGKVEVIQVRHEQSAVHLADGYYRASGKPLAVFTSIGPGAINTVVGLASAFIDSTAVLVLTGGTHTYMMGKGILQELERKHWADFLQLAKPVTKRCWQVERVQQLPQVMHRAFGEMLTGRRGPVLIDVPMDIQAEAADVMLSPARESYESRAAGDSQAIRQAADLLREAQRPVILAGGGAVASGAGDEIVSLAESLVAAIVTTMMGKGVVAENHPLYAWHTGSIGTDCGNRLANTADVILAIGCRFEDQTCSSYVPGKSFPMPAARLIQIDIDPSEIGKNYHVDVGVQGDAKTALSLILQELPDRDDYRAKPYFEDVSALKARWQERVRAIQEVDAVPVTIPRFYKELREFLDDDAIVVTSAGNPQVHLLQTFPFLQPGCNMTSGGFSTMGFTLPAAIGAKLAQPDRQVIGVAGDGDFLMTVQELATAAQYGIPVVIAVLNNFGWQSIRDLQINTLGAGRVQATEFLDSEGDYSSPNFSEVAKAFGVWGKRIDSPAEIKPALKEAFSQERPALVEVMVNLDPEHSMPLQTGGWWDMPVPEYLVDRRKGYETYRCQEQLS